MVDDKVVFGQLCLLCVGSQFAKTQWAICVFVQGHRGPGSNKKGRVSMPVPPAQYDNGQKFKSRIPTLASPLARQSLHCSDISNPVIGERSRVAAWLGLDHRMQIKSVYDAQDIMQPLDQWADTTSPASEDSKTSSKYLSALSQQRLNRQTPKQEKRTTGAGRVVAPGTGGKVAGRPADVKGSIAFGRKTPSSTTKPANSILDAGLQHALTPVSRASIDSSSSIAHSIRSSVSQMGSHKGSAARNQAARHCAFGRTVGKPVPKHSPMRSSMDFRDKGVGNTPQRAAPVNTISPSAASADVRASSASLRHYTSGCADKQDSSTKVRQAAQPHTNGSAIAPPPSLSKAAHVVQQGKAGTAAVTKTPPARSKQSGVKPGVLHSSVVPLETGDTDNIGATSAASRSPAEQQIKQTQLGSRGRTPSSVPALKLKEVASLSQPSRNCAGTHTLTKDANTAEVQPKPQKGLLVQTLCLQKVGTEASQVTSLATPVNELQHKATAKHVASCPADELRLSIGDWIPPVESQHTSPQQFNMPYLCPQGDTPYSDIDLVPVTTGQHSCADCQEFDLQSSPLVPGMLSLDAAVQPGTLTMHGSLRVMCIVLMCLQELNPWYSTESTVYFNAAGSVAARYLQILPEQYSSLTSSCLAELPSKPSCTGGASCSTAEPKGVALPLHKLQSEAMASDSPPKLRRGDRSPRSCMNTQSVVKAGQQATPNRLSAG